MSWALLTPPASSSHPSPYSLALSSAHFSFSSSSRCLSNCNIQMNHLGISVLQILNESEERTHEFLVVLMPRTRTAFWVERLQASGSYPCATSEWPGELVNQLTPGSTSSKAILFLLWKPSHIPLPSSLRYFTQQLPAHCCKSQLKWHFFTGACPSSRLG